MHAQAISPALSQPSRPAARRRLSRSQAQTLRALREDRAQLLAELDRVEAAMQNAQNSFAFVSGAPAVDACIYRIQAAQSQYGYLLLQIRETEAHIRAITAPEGAETSPARRPPRVVACGEA